MSPHDKNFEVGPSASVLGQYSPSREMYDQDSVDSNGRPMDVGDTSNNTHSPVPVRVTLNRSASPRAAAASPARSRPAMPRSVLPAGMTPFVISSSDTADNGLQRRPGSTGVRRTSMSGHSLIVEATRAIGDALTAQMKDMATETNSLERSKLD